MVTITRSQAQITIALLAASHHANKYPNPNNTKSGDVNYKTLLVAVTEFLSNYGLINRDEKNEIINIATNNYKVYGFRKDKFGAVKSLLPLFDGFLSTTIDTVASRANRNICNSKNADAPNHLVEPVVDVDIVGLFNTAVDKLEQVDIELEGEMSPLGIIGAVLDDMKKLDSKCVEFNDAFGKLVDVLDRKFLHAYNVIMRTATPYIVDVIYAVIESSDERLKEKSTYQRLSILLADKDGTAYNGLANIYNELSASPETDVIRQYESFDDFIEVIKKGVDDHYGSRDSWLDSLELEKAIIVACVSDKSAQTYYASLMSIPSTSYLTEDRYIAASLYGIISSLMLN